MIRTLACAVLAAALVLPLVACSKKKTEPVAAAVAPEPAPDAAQEAQEAQEAKDAAHQKHLDDGTAALAAGDPDAAITHLKQAVSAKPYSAEAHYQIGRAYVAKKDDAAAQKAFGEAIRLDPEHAGAFIERGAIHDRAGRLTDASFDYRKAIAIERDPKTTARAYWLRGDVMSRLGKREDYRFDWEKAMALDPEYRKRVTGADLRVFNHTDQKIKLVFNQFINADGTERTFPPGFSFAIPEDNTVYLLHSDQPLVAKSVRFTLTGRFVTKTFTAAYEKGMTFEIHIYEADLPK